MENGFADDLRIPILIISCEDGDVEYGETDKTVKGQRGSGLFEEEEDFTPGNIRELNDTYHPDAVFIEYNGTWEVGPLYEMEGPKDWTIVQACVL